MSLPLPLLVTGIAGVPGYNAFRYFRRQYPGQVVGIRQTDNVRLTGEGVEACDAEDPVGLARLFDRYQFKSVLNAAGNCALRSCELDADRAFRINVDGVRNLLTQTAGLRLVHLSVDLVFSGENEVGGYTEEDPTDPVTVYGKTMVAAEKLVLEAAPQALILRISLPMGVSFNGHAGAIDWITSRFKKGRPATLYFDEVRTPTYTDCMNRLYETLLSGTLSGLYHGGGSRQMALYEIAQVINRVGGYDPQLLMGCPRAAAGPVPPRAGNVSLNSTKLLKALGYDPFDPWPLAPEHVPTSRDWHHDRQNGEPGSVELLAQVLCRNPAREDRCEPLDGPMKT